MLPETTGSSGFTAEEEAELQAGDDIIDDVGQDGEGGEESQPAAKEPEQKAEAKPNGKAPDGYVPQAALHEARQRGKEDRERADRMEKMFQRLMEDRQQPKQGAKDAEIPAYDVDPLGHTKGLLDRAVRELQEIKGAHQERTKQEEQYAQTQQKLSQYANAVSTFKRQTPDYDEAFQFLNDVRDKELAVFIEDPNERAERLQYEEGVIAGRAMAQGKSPAQIFYDLAKHRGFGAKLAQEENKIERLQKGQQAAKSLGGGKAPEGEMSLDRLTKLADEDPEEFDKQWRIMQRKGMLG